MKKILVTGGLGFIGSHLIEKLCNEQQCSIDIVDNLINNCMNPEEAIHENIANVYTCSVDDFELKEKYDEIYHLASPVGPAGVLRFAGKMGQIILNDDMKIAEYAYENDAKVMFISTSEVYGKDPGTESQREDIDKVVPSKVTVRLEYGVGKMLAEICVMNYALEHKFRYNIIRPFNIVGVGQSSKAGFVIPRFVTSALRDEDITVFGDGEQRRTFTHVKDIVNAIVNVMNSDISGEIFNVGNPENEYSISEIAHIIKERTRSKSKIICMDPKDIYGKYYEEAWNKIPNIDKLTSMSDWRPQYPFLDIIDEIIEDTEDMMKHNKKRPNEE